MKDSMKDLLKDSLGKVQARQRDERDARLDEAWSTGYETAAEACLGVLASTIAELQSRLGSLAKDEQVLLSRLHELQKTTKEELGAPWSRRSGT